MGIILKHPGLGVRQVLRHTFKRCSAFELLCYACMAIMLSRAVVLPVHADNFTDIFYTQSFRGAFAWMEKLDWVGMILQAVISIFSVVGVSLVCIRIMTSILYLSSKGLWDEVSDLKDSGGESEYFDFGLLNMAKNWAKGKAGTGLDAIIGAVLILLPNVKRYSDFGPNAGGKFEEDLSVTQYVLKVALPTVMIVFFCAMGFNGTLWQALAVTVDAMGTVADTAVSVNYAGFVQDLVNEGSGFNFTFSASGTNEGDLKQKIASDVYGRCVSKIRGANQNQLQEIGRKVQEQVTGIKASDSTLVSAEVVEGLNNSDLADKYWGYLGYDLIVNTSGEQTAGETVIAVKDMMPESVASTYSDENAEYIHLYIKQTKSVSGSFFNTDGVERN